MTCTPALCSTASICHVVICWILSRYVDDAGDLDAPDGVSYADWEAQQAVNVQVPAWMEAVLRVPGGGICLLLILLPVTLVRAWNFLRVCHRDRAQTRAAEMPPSYRHERVLVCLHYAPMQRTRPGPSYCCAPSGIPHLICCSKCRLAAGLLAACIACMRCTIDRGSCRSSSVPLSEASACQGDPCGESRRTALQKHHCAPQSFSHFRSASRWLHM